MFIVEPAGASRVDHFQPHARSVVVLQKNYTTRKIIIWYFINLNIYIFAYCFFYLEPAIMHANHLEFINCSGSVIADGKMHPCELERVGGGRNHLFPVQKACTHECKVKDIGVHLPFSQLQPPLSWKRSRFSSCILCSAAQKPVPLRNYGLLDFIWARARAHIRKWVPLKKMYT